MDVRTVTVLGAGTMGHGIAHAAAASGFETRLYDVSAAQLERARDTIAGIFKAGVDRGKISATRRKTPIAMTSTWKLRTSISFRYVQDSHSSEDSTRL